jgi:hypothetical protein
LWQILQLIQVNSNQQSSSDTLAANDDKAAEANVEAPSNSEHQFGSPTPLRRTSRLKSPSPNVSWANEYASGSGSPFAKLVKDSPSYPLECLPATASIPHEQSQRSETETDEFVVVAPSTQGDPTPAASVIMTPDGDNAPVCSTEQGTSSSAAQNQTSKHPAEENVSKKPEVDETPAVKTIEPEDDDSDTRYVIVSR